MSGSNLERTVSNKDTLRRQWDELMSACRYDDAGMIGKTIIFALTQDHALRLKDMFDEMYPQYPDLAAVITYKSEYKGTLVGRFKKENQPRIAISVDMLETGVNVPEVVNLVFMRPVQSGLKLAQMIGRGTRTRDACEHPEWLPDGKKDSFLILDFWENDFKKDPSKAASPSLPVLVSVFNTRLKLMRAYLPDQNDPAAQATKAALRAMASRLPRDTYKVQQAEAEIGQVWGEGFWTYLNANKLDFLKVKVGPLLRLASEVDVAGETFTNKVERLKLETLNREATAATMTSIMDDVGRSGLRLRAADTLRFSLGKTYRQRPEPSIFTLILSGFARRLRAAGFPAAGAVLKKSGLSRLRIAQLSGIGKTVFSSRLTRSCRTDLA